jgi:hypothetical protein
MSINLSDVDAARRRFPIVHIPIGFVYAYATSMSNAKDLIRSADKARRAFFSLASRALKSC